MKTPIFLGCLIVLPVAVICIAAAVWNPRVDFWGTVELPKAQCEAYDVARLKTMTTLSSEIYDAQKLRRLFREPQNTCSNLAYIVVGAAVLFASSRPLSFGFGAAGVFLGIGSGLYHASLQPEWRMLDILGVYLVLFALCAIGLSTFFALKGRAYDFTVTAFIVLAAFASGVHRNDVRIAGFKLFDSTYVVVAGVSLASAFVIFCYSRARNRTRYLCVLLAVTSSAVIAFCGGISDRFGGSMANPDALIQGHSLWHVFGAVALLAAYELFAIAGFDSSIFEIRKRISRVRDVGPATS